MTSATRARTHEGSGIGLALVQELVRMHGGTIAAESTYGAGTTFTVSVPKGFEHLPVERLSNAGSRPTSSVTSAFLEEALRWLPDEERTSYPNAEGAESPLSLVALATGTRESVRVLVADDNADMREYLRRILSTRWIVETVSDGRAALRAVSERRPDVVVTDVMMPVLDGFRLLKMLREDAATRSIPVIMLSARAGEESRVEGLQAGAEDYLVKPFSARELIARVEAQIAASRLRQALELERGKLQSLFENAPAVIFAFKGPDHVFELANQHYHQVIGKRDVIGLPIRKALPELEGQGFYELLDGVYQTGTPHFGNETRAMVNRRGDGQLEERFYNFVYYPSRDIGGEVDGILAFAFDVTDQVVARRVAEAAHKQAEAAVQARDEFLSIASHELRTPLTTLGLQIDGLVGSLSSSSAEPTPQRWLTKAERLRGQADRLEQLIEDMLDVFVLGRELVELNREEVDLAILAREVIDRLRPEAKKAKAIVELSAKSAVGRWDRRRLAQVLTQLLSNALKFGAGKAVHVVVDSSGNSARLRVADRGVGIAAEDHERIFGRFERATSSNHYGGFGLGLWIVRQIVTAMRGTVRVESEPGRGSTFIVELPRQT